MRTDLMPRTLIRLGKELGRVKIAVALLVLGTVLIIAGMALGGPAESGSVARVVAVLMQVIGVVMMFYGGIRVLIGTSPPSRAGAQRPQRLPQVVLFYGDGTRPVQRANRCRTRCQRLWCRKTGTWPPCTWEPTPLATMKAPTASAAVPVPTIPGAAAIVGL